MLKLVEQVVEQVWTGSRFGNLVPWAFEIGRGGKFRREKPWERDYVFGELNAPSETYRFVNVPARKLFSIIEVLIKFNCFQFEASSAL